MSPFRSYGRQSQGHGQPPIGRRAQEVDIRIELILAGARPHECETRGYPQLVRLAHGAVFNTDISDTYVHIGNVSKNEGPGQ